MLRARMHFPEAKMVNWPDIGKAQGLSLYLEVPTAFCHCQDPA